MKNIGFFLSENFQFLVVKFSICLNRRVFVMIRCLCGGVDAIRPRSRHKYEVQREKRSLTCALNEDANKPAHPRSLIRVFVILTKKLYILGYPNCAQ